jgi:hypothetical protein
VLLEICARCHDGRGNPALAKNHFDVLKLDQLSRSEKDLAISRLTAPTIGCACRPGASAR